MKLVTVSQASEMDKTAMEDYSIPEMILMENAAAATCKVIKNKFLIEENNFLILCGSGNNGGDGLALARLLYSEGGAPLVLMMGGSEKLKGSALKNYNILKNYPIEIIHNFSSETFLKELGETDIIIDALLGTGLSREISGELKNYIGIINSSEKPIISIDIPSGVNGNTGQVMGIAVKAQFTVSFGALKPGNILYPGYSNNGELYLSRISLPPEIYDSDHFKIELSAIPPLPVRDEAAYKKTFGDILTISGASSYYGAPVLAASAVLKSGGGFSRLAVPSSMVSVLASNLREAVFLPMDETLQKSISPANLPHLLEESKKSNGVIIGPGLSLNKETARLICDFLRSYRKFIVIDGDALSAIAGKPELITGREIPAVLTPHLGEMSRISSYSIKEIQKNPVNILVECAKRYEAIIVMKGAHSLIGMPDGRVFVNTTGNSGMGTAGSGDILTGIIAAFSGLGQEIENCVKSAVFIHGTAGDLAAEKYGKDGMTAGDILKMLPYAVKHYREDYNGLIHKYKKIIHEV